MRAFLPFTLLAAMALLVGSPARAGAQKDEGLTDQQFGRLLTMFLEDPLHEKGKDIARLMIVFTLQTPKAALYRLLSIGLQAHSPGNARIVRAKHIPSVNGKRLGLPKNGARGMRPRRSIRRD